MGVTDILGKCKKCGSHKVANDGLSIYCEDCGETLEQLEQDDENDNGYSSENTGTERMEK